ncbi:MAG: hypothetical protein IJN63_05760, partial [Clostridia bacterium]|nr:hypothetical protein [Clostridia bacterium]
MDKNGNGSPAQFSPEELIRRLKSQLNINSEDKAENETPVKDPVDAETVHPEDIAVSEDVAAEGTDGVEIESVNVDPDVNDDAAVDDVADVEVNEVSAEEAESDVVDESEEEAAG